MLVRLLAFTPNPDKIASIAARTCYSSDSIKNIEESLTKDKMEYILNKVIKSNHTSVLEHVNFTFSIEDISRVLLAQLTRHRIASFSVKSQRYVNHINTSYYIPDTIANNEELKQKYDSYVNSAKELYKEFKIQGIPIEDARYLLPNSTSTSLVMTMNARELLHFFNLRCCKRAQKEIRDLANIMLSLVKIEAPIIFKNAGSPCVSNKCTEDKPCKGRSN